MAPLPLSLLSTINNWFPSKEKGTATGIFLAAAKFGPVIVPPIGALLIAAFGWRSIFYGFAVPGFFLALIWLMMVSDDPKQSGRVEPGDG
jgi:MFS transporter, ACS family, glucarate transporter